MHDEEDATAKTRYDVTAIAMLAGLEPVRARGLTIVNGADLSEAESELICRMISGNSDIWQIEVMGKSGRTTRIFRDA